MTVADTLPAGLTATAISGTGWTCTLGTLTCTRSDALPPSASDPTTITPPIAAIPALSPELLALLAAILGLIALRTVKD